MMSEKRPEVVIITGGSAGIGRAAVRKFALRGARIGIIARNCDRLQETVEEAKAIGSRAIGVSADVANAEQVENAASEIELFLGPLDIWVNNAMVSMLSPFTHVLPEEFKRVTDVTYHGYVYGTMAALRRMIPRNHGTIVQVSSVLAYRSVPLRSACCGAKHGVIGFTDSIRSELVHDKSNVRITTVHLPSVNTPQFDWIRSKLERKPQPIPPVFQPEVAADAIVWAAHNRRREVYVGAPSVEASWGQKFIPGMLDRYFARFYYQAQQTENPEDPFRRDNLYESVDSNQEAHGSFDSRARRTSLQLWLTKHRYSIFLALAAGVLAIAGNIAYAGGSRRLPAKRHETRRGKTTTPKDASTSRASLQYFKNAA